LQRIGQSRFGKFLVQVVEIFKHGFAPSKERNAEFHRGENLRNLRNLWISYSSSNKPSGGVRR
jgi:hypothetical protein